MGTAIGDGLVAAMEQAAEQVPPTESKIEPKPATAVQKACAQSFFKKLSQQITKSHHSGMYILAQDNCIEIRNDAQNALIVFNVDNLVMSDQGFALESMASMLGTLDDDEDLTIAFPLNPLNPNEISFDQATVQYNGRNRTILKQSLMDVLKPSFGQDMKLSDWLIENFSTMIVEAFDGYQKAYGMADPFFRSGSGYMVTKRSKPIIEQGRELTAMVRDRFGKDYQDLAYSMSVRSVQDVIKAVQQEIYQAKPPEKKLEQ